jgi:transposase
MAWLSGSGYTSLPLLHTSVKRCAYEQRRSRCPLEPVFGRFLRYHLHYRIVLSTTMANIRSLTVQLKGLDKTIAAELQAIPQTLDSVPGLGPVWRAGLIAELGDVSRFADDDAIAQFAGLTWPAHESGQFQAEDTPLSQRGNRYLRYYLVEAANSVRRHCPEYTDYYAANTPRPPSTRISGPWS